MHKLWRERVNAKSSQPTVRLHPHHAQQEECERLKLCFTSLGKLRGKNTFRSAFQTGNSRAFICIPIHVSATKRKRTCNKHYCALEICPYGGKTSF